MDANKYQIAAARTLLFKPEAPLTNDEILIMVNCLELQVSVSEVLEYYKKGVLHRHGFSHDAFQEKVSTVYAMLDNLNYNVPAYKGKPTDKEIMMLWNLVGLGGEVGELIGIFLSVLRGITTFQEKLDSIEKEAGDILWYVAANLTKLGLKLGTVMELNNLKTWIRFRGKGFSSEDSKARIDVKAGEA